VDEGFGQVRAHEAIGARDQHRSTGKELGEVGSESRQLFRGPKAIRRVLHRRYDNPTTAMLTRASRKDSRSNANPA
jgi:hypothetical protein